MYLFDKNVLCQNKMLILSRHLTVPANEIRADEFNYLIHI